MNLLLPILGLPLLDRLSFFLALPAAEPNPTLAPGPALLLAARLIWGPRAWPAILAGALVEQLCLRAPLPAVAMAAVIAAATLAAAAYMERFAAGMHYMDRPKDLAHYLLGPGLLVWIPAAVAQAGILVAAGSVPDLRTTAVAIWLAQVVGLLWVTTLAVGIHVEGARFLARCRKHWPEVLVMLVWAAACVAVAYTRSIEIQAFLAPLVVWCGFRLRVVGATSLVLGFIAVFGYMTVHGMGALGLHLAPAQAVFVLKARMAAQAVVVLLLLAVLEENRRHKDSLEADVAARTQEAIAARLEAEAANEAKSQFLASMSHEIRTPLTAMMASADLLTDPDPNGYAGVIRRNGEHLLALINDILDLSKIEAGELTLERIPTPVGPLFADMASLMRPRAAEKGVAFDVILKTPLPATIESDPTRLRQVILNLVGNAVKFTTQGQVRVELSYDQALTVAIHDTGIGIPQDQLPLLFQPFRQVDASMTRRFGGSGLGLAICKHLATAMGGGITVQSQLGQGSTFTLSLPVTGSGQILDLTTTAEKPASLAEGELSGRVLFAEDGPDNQLLIRVLLQKMGLEVTVAENGQIALDHASATSYDVVLMDMQMPVMDGYTATARLREQGYRGPIVALTAHAMAGERERCLAAGCDDYLSKPIDRQALRALLSRLMA